MTIINGADLLAALIVAALIYLVVRETRRIRDAREARRLHEINQAYHQHIESWEECAYRANLRMTSGRGL